MKTYKKKEVKKKRLEKFTVKIFFCIIDCPSVTEDAIGIHIIYIISMLQCSILNQQLDFDDMINDVVIQFCQHAYDS